MTSVIIPACNEEAVIGRGLETLLRGARSGELQVIVVCNGCCDRTAAVARAFGPPVTVIESAEASKVAALNMGDSVATSFPRIYLDADVRLNIQGVRALTELLTSPGGGAPAASPALQMDLSASNWGVRAFYKVWLALPYTREGMIGVGTLALSESGRNRFGRFPNVINDDGYVRLLFSANERPVVPAAEAIVTAPATLSGLCAIMTRSRLGIYQLNREFPDLKRREQATKTYGYALALILSRPSMWPAGAVYLGVNVASRWRARRQARNLDQYVWERDESSRPARQIERA